MFCSLPQSLSSGVYSFPCRDHAHPLLSLLLGGCLIFFEVIVNGTISIYSFSVCLLLVYRKSNHFYKVILYPATLLPFLHASQG
jgi:hypothetical protein